MSSKPGSRLDQPEHSVIVVDFPEMRDQVIAALRSLSDPQHQVTRWGTAEPGVNYYDDLTINVHILYDDCAVLPDPFDDHRIDPR